MNDRFKFRIFEYETKEMIELDAVGYSSFDPFAKGKNRLIMIPSGLGNTFHYDKQCLYDNDKFSEPMQCTGLHDKNGKLIYEGDIVRIFHLSSTGQPRTYIGEVYYYKVRPSFQVKGYGFIDEDDVVEVIGNIYENPELLEKTNER